MPARACARSWRNAISGSTDPQAPRRATHAVVVLGASLTRTGEASPALVRRLKAGIDLHGSLEDSVLVCAGGAVLPGPSEASVMRDIALSEGVSSSDILLEDSSVNTRENIQNTLSLIGPATATRLHFVSDASHIRRCRLYCFLTGIPADFHPVPAGPGEEGIRRFAAVEIYEAAALFKYAAVGLIDRFR